MPYTVWSRGRLIGETDLGFVRIIEQFVSGWFHPNAEGERVMPMAASPVPAMRACMHRKAVDASGQRFVQPELEESTVVADLAEAFQYLQSLELELRRQDGSVVPTSDICMRDTHRLLALAEEERDETEEENEDDEDRLGDDGFGDDSSSAWAPDDLDVPQFPRYQIHVELLHPDDLPGRVLVPFGGECPD